MSQVFRRLKLIADGAGAPSRSYSISSLLLQNSSSEPVCIGPAFSRRLLRQQALLNHAGKYDLQGATAHRGATVQIQNRRSMSILTDLLRRKKKPEEEDEEEAASEGKTLPLFIEEPKQLTEEEIEAKRNISRLQPRHQRLVNGQLPYDEPAAWFHHTVRYKQKMFGKYGESSGVNAGILWPTRKELRNQIEYENFCNPLTIQEMMEKKRAIREEEKSAREKRIKMVQTNMERLEEMKKDLFRRQQAKEDEATEAKERREKLVEEVRRHFGYTVDPRDERFQEMLAKKEKEQKKSMKEARKLAKQQKMLDKMQGNSESKSKEIKPIKTDRRKAVDDDDD